MNYELLRSYIKDSGLKISFLANKIGMTRQSLNAKISGRRSFSQSEIMALKQALRLDDNTFMRIFLRSVYPKWLQGNNHDPLRSLSSTRKIFQNVG